MTTGVLQNLLNEDITPDERRILVSQQFDLFINQGLQEQDAHVPERSKTLGQAKSLLEFYDLVRQAILDYESRASVPEEQKVIFTEEEPDADSETETITFSLVSRDPGSFSQGAPMKGRVKNLRPIHREISNDLNDPGYRKVISGYWFDNIIRLTCWARTNKAANARARWLENLMEDYQWWFVLQGVKRVIYDGQRSDLVTVIKDNKWYGRPLDYFVQTEKLKVFHEKTLEEMILRLSVKKE